MSLFKHSTFTTIHHLAAVPTNVTVRSLSPTSVEVSWVAPSIPELLQWVVYYSPSGNASAMELSVNVSSRNTSVMISSLQAGVVYVFEVQAVIMVDGEVVFGNRTVAAKVEENSKSPIMYIARQWSYICIKNS